MLAWSRVGDDVRSATQGQRSSANTFWNSYLLACICVKNRSEAVVRFYRVHELGEGQSLPVSKDTPVSNTALLLASS
jgi:hypothetical protein